METSMSPQLFIVSTYEAILAGTDPRKFETLTGFLVGSPGGQNNQIAFTRARRTRLLVGSTSLPSATPAGVGVSRATLGKSQ